MNADIGPELVSSLLSIRSMQIAYDAHDEENKQIALRFNQHIKDLPRACDMCQTKTEGFLGYPFKFRWNP